MCEWEGRGMGETLHDAAAAATKLNRKEGAITIHKVKN